MIGYTAKILDTFEYSPGGWKGLRVGIFLVSHDGEEQIGEYTRTGLIRAVCVRMWSNSRQDFLGHAVQAPLRLLVRLV